MDSLHGEIRFTDSQIVAELKEVELGATVGGTCRKYCVSESPYHKRKRQLAGVSACSLAQLGELQEDNARLVLVDAVDHPGASNPRHCFGLLYGSACHQGNPNPPTDC